MPLTARALTVFWWVRRAVAVGAIFFVKRIPRAEESQKRRYGVILYPVNYPQ